MQRITIGRYKRADTEVDIDLQNGTSTSIDVADLYDGWIEGVRDDGTSWIMWLNAAGSPESFWGSRDEDGGVEGKPVDLTV